MNNKKIFLVILVIQILFLGMNAFANTAMENQELAKIQQVIRSLYPMINVAEQQQVKSNRIQFRYDWLRCDLALIQKGISSKLHGVLVEPRYFKSIHGDYIEMSSGD